MFSAPYLENRLVLVGRYGADVSAKSLTDLKGRRVAIVEGYAYGDAVEQSGAIVRARRQRGRMPRAAAQARGRLHADGRSRGRVHRPQLSEGVGDAAADRFDAAHHAGAPSRAAANASGRRVDHRRLQRTAARHGRRSDLPSAAARGLDCRRHQRRQPARVWCPRPIVRDRSHRSASTRSSRSSPRRSSRRCRRSKMAKDPVTNSGFYIGGNIYSDWASVPENYKTTNSRAPDPRRSTATLFTFSW